MEDSPPLRLIEVLPTCFFKNLSDLVDFTLMMCIFHNILPNFSILRLFEKISKILEENSGKILL